VDRFGFPPKGEDRFISVVKGCRRLYLKVRLDGSCGRCRVQSVEIVPGEWGSVS
jgi:hypothetical protein